MRKVHFLAPKPLKSLARGQNCRSKGDALSGRPGKTA